MKWNKVEEKGIVCTYTTGSIPATKTQSLRDVLEVRGLGVLDRDACRSGIAIAIKTRNGLGD
jgi:hypothetical protein